LRWSHNTGFAFAVINAGVFLRGLSFVRAFLKTVILAAAVAGSALPASAATVTFNFSNSSGQANFGAFAGTDANGRIYTAGTGANQVRVRASGWSNDGTTIRDSFLGAFAGGLGVTSGDDVPGDGNRHTVDNQHRMDFILLQFDHAVELDSAVFNAFTLAGQTYKDNDATIGYGNTTLAWNTQPGLNNKNVSALNTLIPVTNRFASTGTGSSAVRPINTNNFVSNIWLISAAMANHNADERFDSFKLNTLVVTKQTGQVPEPATWAMMIAGFGMVGGALRMTSGRRRKTLARAAAA
jgi:hypothetical protein